MCACFMYHWSLLGMHVFLYREGNVSDPYVAGMKRGSTYYPGKQVSAEWGRHPCRRKKDHTP